MNSIAFIDTEIQPRERRILDIGCVKNDGSTFHEASLAKFASFLNRTKFICGHNILNHDLKYLSRSFSEHGVIVHNAIDTLHLSPLLFPEQPYHALLKDDKLQTDELNNPLNDAIKAKDLFYDEIAAFSRLDDGLKKILYLLLRDQKEFSGFFRFLSYFPSIGDTVGLIRKRFSDHICNSAPIERILTDNPIELAYCLSLLNVFLRNNKSHSVTPPWVLKNYPEVERIMFLLRNKPCTAGCNYCNKALDAHIGLKKVFGFESFRTYGEEPLQENAIKAALSNKSLLAIFPTGGGKSITFQLPALMSGENARALTVVISPLQSLMKDQVDNLEKIGITDAVTINGLLDPIDRAKSFERVEDGSASLLYISPESLRSKSIERLILGRKIARFVIDEAHCFSSWGQDFRVDYLYIGDFIKNIQEKKNLQDGIPVSCFTATAKQNVIEDIRNYFNDKLSLDLEVFSSKASRTNLHYQVFQKENEDDKYQAMRNLIEEKNCPTIVYVSRTHRANELAKRLTEDGFNALAYHGKMETQDKVTNQNAFLSGEVSVMVATSAFGMGVDKKDVGMVIHYDISDSLENYVQEAGRAGRDENIVAECFVLYNEEDLGKHFILLNQTKLSIKEIQQVWKAIKDITRFRSTVSNSALEIARKAGWDDTVAEIETRVKTAIAALEGAGYIKRGQNMPQIFANSILSKNAQEAIDKINACEKFVEGQKEKAVRIIKKLFSSKRRKESDDSGESRIDYISDHLGIVKEDVMRVITLLKEEKILADTKDLTGFIRRGENSNRSLSVAESYLKTEKFLLSLLEEDEKTFHLKEINEQAEAQGCTDASINKIKTVLNFWSIKNWISRKNLEYSRNHVAVHCIQPPPDLQRKFERRQELARFVISYLFEKSALTPPEDNLREEILVEFSVHELKEQFEDRLNLFGTAIGVEDIEDTLYYLSKIEAIKIEGGFLVIYNRLTIERLEKDNKVRYKAEDYQRLNQFYENKVQQIHIVGEYAKKMISDYKEALQFVDDYFHLNYQSFLNKYFKGSRQNEIRQNLTPAKFRQIFGDLSPAQLNIIKDNESKYIAVLAGPGSGKTRVLVHKLASLLLMEDVKHEQLLMLTFSRAAATEFKQRLMTLIQNAAHFVEIRTFHSYCFDLLGKVGTLEKTDDILQRTVQKIKSGDVEPNRITKAVLVIDEAQDMNQDEFNVVLALMELNEDMRVIAVGDDDQNIYEFRGSDSKYLEQFIRDQQATMYELLENYRSKQNLVGASNSVASQIRTRLKHMPIVAKQRDSGKIRIVRHYNGNLICPLVDDVLSANITGTTCILTRTNDEASKIVGLLIKNGFPAKLIQSNDGFNLYNLLEIRYFLNLLELSENVYIIADETWESAKREFSKTFANSSILDVCHNLIKQFESVNVKRKYRSDLEVFIRESKIEDFYRTTSEVIFVSTIHKAKGREYDNVYLMLENFDYSTDECRRQLYVAMTRAKRNLTVHLNSDFLNELNMEEVVNIQDHEVHLPPVGIAIQLTHKDLWLDYFIDRQQLVSNLLSGQILRADAKECLNEQGYTVARFSKSLVEKIETFQSHGYIIIGAKVNFVVYWLKEGAEKEIKIVLPEIYLEKSTSDREGYMVP